MNIVCYRMQRYVFATEVKKCRHYGTDDSSLFFDCMEYSGKRAGEYRVSIGTGRLAALWVTPQNDMLMLETTYLQQGDVEEILYAFACDMNVTLKLYAGDGLMDHPTRIEAGTPLLRLVN